MFKKLAFLACALLTLAPNLYSRAHPLILQSKYQTDTLFIQQATSATLKANPEIPNQYILTLRGIYPRIVFIKNESKHIAGVIQLADFLNNWKENEAVFGDEGPSAIMSYLSFKPTIQSGVETDVLELSHPIYEKASNSIHFTAKPNHNDTVKTGRFKNVVIIYDGINASSKDLKSEYKVLEGPPSN